MKGTKLWQPTGSPIIQGRSRTYTPFWRDVLKAILTAGVLVAVYDWFVSDPYTLTLGEATEFGASFVIGALLALLPSIAVLALVRSYRVKRAWLPAGAVGGVCAVLFLLAQPLLPL